MDMETWRKLLGKSQDDPAFKAALAAVGVKKVPKLSKDKFRVIFDLKGHGLWLEMTDEAYLKKLEDQDIGEGPVILTVIGAYLDKSESRDLYKGPLPYSLTADMARTDVRKRLGPPTRSGDVPPFDIWSRDDLEVTAGYTEELKLAHFNFRMPRSP